MNKKKFFTRIGAVVMAIAMLCTSMISASAATVPDATIDTTKTASLELYKYDFTTANKDGKLEQNSYVSTGQRMDAVEQALADYAIKGVEFTYLKVADIYQHTDNEPDSGSTIHKNMVLYQMSKGTQSAAFLAALGLTKDDAYKSDNDFLYFESDVLINALSNALVTNETTAKNGLEAFVKENGGKVVPSINFQHIIVPEIYDALKEIKFVRLGCIIRKKNPLNDKTRYYVLPDAAKGELREYPCPPYYNNGQYDAMLEVGDVLATVSGHDHENTFEIDYKGIKIINTPTVGFNAYKDKNVGSRVFVIDENEPESFETYCLTYSDIYTDVDELYEARILYNIDTTGWFTKLKSLIKIAKADDMSFKDFAGGVVHIFKNIQLF